MNTAASSTASRAIGATTGKFIDHVASAPLDGLPTEAMDYARTFLLDALAVGMAGNCNAASVPLIAAAQKWDGGAIGQCRVLGRGDLNLSPHSAAVVNGFLIHCLEWDALHEPSVVIATCVTTAALLSEAQTSDVSLDELLAALVIGVEVAVFFGAASRSQPKFFRPSVAGTMGAAMALGRLRGFDKTTLTNCLGLAYSQGSGTMQAHWEGSETLPLQVGIGARAALTAADLAGAGFTAPHDVIDGKFGYFKLIEEGAADLTPYLEGFGAPWKIAEVAHKPFPAGRATQSVLTAIMDMRAEHPFEMEDIAMLDAHVPPLIMLLVGRPWMADMTAGYARLCLEFVVPEMIREGRVDPRRFNAENFDTPRAQADAQRITLHLDDNQNPNALGPQRIVVTLRDGRVLEQTVDAPYGSPLRPMSREAQQEKAAFCFAIAGLPDRSAQLFADAAGGGGAGTIADTLDLLTKQQVGEA